MSSVSNKLLCTVYRSSREAELYVYVKREEGLTRLPEPLLNKLGAMSEVMTLVLNAERKLARASAPEVIAALNDKGFYLQLPPNLDPARFTLGG